MIARIWKDGTVLREAQLAFSGEVSIFTGDLELPEQGDFEIEVIAADARTANFGSVKGSFSASGS